LKKRVLDSIYHDFCSVRDIPLIFFSYLYPTVYRQNPVDQSIALISRDAPTLAYKTFNPAFVYRLSQRVPTYPDSVTLSARISETPDAVVISRAIYEPELLRMGLQTIWKGKDLFEHHTTVLMKKSWVREDK
jgi:hypothetical protein